MARREREARSAGQASAQAGSSISMLVCCCAKAPELRAQAAQKGRSLLAVGSAELAGRLPQLTPPTLAAGGPGLGPGLCLSWPALECLEAYLLTAGWPTR